METYTVICRTSNGKGAFKVYFPAESPTEAVAAARARGHTVEKLVSPTDGQIDLVGSLAENTRTLAACRKCGYSLFGLPRENGIAHCPECGTDNTVALERVEPFSSYQLARWGVVLGCFGIIWPTASFTGIALGALALDHSANKKGKWAIGTSLVCLALYLPIAALRSRYLHI